MKQHTSHTYTNSLLIRPCLVISNILHHISSIQHHPTKIHTFARKSLGLSWTLHNFQPPTTQPPTYKTNVSSWGTGGVVQFVETNRWKVPLDFAYIQCDISCANYELRVISVIMRHSSSKSRSLNCPPKKHERIPGLFVWDPWFMILFNYQFMSYSHSTKRPWN